MLGELVPIGGGDPIPLSKPKLLIGRRPSCDITLDFPNISSHHCELEFLNGYWHIRDMSRNGVKVNGERISEKFLQPGDRVDIARHPYEINYVPQADAPPAELVEENPFAKSLLEKAGLERSPSQRPVKREQKSTPPSRTITSPQAPVRNEDQSAAKPDHQKSSEDRVVDWLNE